MAPLSVMGALCWLPGCDPVWWPRMVCVLHDDRFISLGIGVGDWACSVLAWLLPYLLVRACLCS